MGKLTFTDGANYEGNFVDNEISGYGTYNWPDGRIYVGNWLDNKMHGEGTLKWPDGKCYKGVIYNIYLRIMNLIKSKGEEYFILEMVENMWVHG
jgi:hypothetical protein